MATEEITKPAAEAPKPAAAAQQSNVGNGDMAHLIGNVGLIIDSTIESVQGMLNSVSSATEQIIEGVTTTINSEPVKEIIQNVNTVSGQLIENVTATLKSEPIQNSFNELGKFWEGLISNLNTTVNSGQVKNLFDNVSAGMNQLVGTVFSPAAHPSFMPIDERKKHPQEIHMISSKDAHATAPTAPAPPVAAPAPTPVVAVPAPVAPAPVAAPAAPVTPAPAAKPVVEYKPSNPGNKPAGK
ncbi:MAG: chlorosome envelope protein H [Chlorobiaceae bacterium]|nr:chlorosome envelope protein H [Chlorobiaceae bacterium]